MHPDFIVHLTTNRPEWANYIAMDDDGAWFWYEQEPKRENGKWFWTTDGQYLRVEFDWTKTVIKV